MGSPLTLMFSWTAIFSNCSAPSLYIKNSWRLQQAIKIGVARATLPLMRDKNTPTTDEDAKLLFGNNAVSRIIVTVTILKRS